jgi:hypothetical protein
MDSGKLEHARWILERQLHWIATVETKTAVILSIDTAMLGALAVAYSDLASGERTAWCVVLTILAAIPLAVSIVYGALAVRPQTDGPATSFIFFGRIKDLSIDKYRSEFVAANDDALLKDCLAQVHRNAEIANHKYKRIGSSMKLAFVGLPIWLIAVAVLVAARS